MYIKFWHPTNNAICIQKVNCLSVEYILNFWTIREQTEISYISNFMTLFEDFVGDPRFCPNEQGLYEIPDEHFYASAYIGRFKTEIEASEILEDVIRAIEKGKKVYDLVGKTKGLFHDPNYNRGD